MYTRDPAYYLASDMRVFQIEDRLYRVHTLFLTEHSQVFRDMFTLPQPTSPSSGDEGSSDENPIVIPGVSVLEFESLLHFFYRGMFKGFQPPGQNWGALLSIARRFDFADVVEEASYRIQALTPVDQLIIAEKYDLPRENFSEAFRALAGRSQTLTQEEIARMPPSLLHRLITTREERLRRMSQLMF